MMITLEKAMPIAIEMADRVEELMADQLPMEITGYLNEPDINDVVNSYSFVYNLTLKVLGDRHEQT